MKGWGILDTEVLSKEDNYKLWLNLLRVSRGFREIFKEVKNRQKFCTEKIFTIEEEIYNLIRRKNPPKDKLTSDGELSIGYRENSETLEDKYWKLIFVRDEILQLKHVIESIKYDFELDVLFEYIGVDAKGNSYYTKSALIDEFDSTLVKIGVLLDYVKGERPLFQKLRSKVSNREF